MKISKALEALQKLVEAAETSDDCQYGTLSTTFVRDLANEGIAALSTPFLEVAEPAPAEAVTHLRWLVAFAIAELAHAAEEGDPFLGTVEKVRDWLEKVLADMPADADMGLAVLGSTQHLDRLAVLAAPAPAGVEEFPLPEARETAEPVPFILGNQYRTQGGELVRFVSVHNAGNSYETMADEQGRHRYTSPSRGRDMGRLTGTAHDYSDAGNVPPLRSYSASLGLQARTEGKV